MTTRQRNLIGFTAFVLAGAIAGTWVSSLLPRPYVSKATLFIEQKCGGVIDRLSAATQILLSREFLRPLILQEGLYKRELDRLPMEDVIDKMRNNIRIGRIGPKLMVREIPVSFQYEEGAAAERTTRVLMERMISADREIDAPGQERSKQPPLLEVLQMPRPVHPGGRGLIAPVLRLVSSAFSQSQITYQGVLRVREPESVSVGAPDANQLRKMVLDALKDQAESEHVNFQVPQSESIDTTVANLRRRLRFELDQSGDQLHIFYSDASPDQAQETLQQILGRVLEKHIRDGDGPVVEIYDRASLPESYEGWTPVTIVTVGAGLGFLIGFVCLRLLLRRDPAGLRELPA